MFDLILNATFFSGLLVLAISLEDGRQSTSLSGAHSNCTSIVCRYIIIALVVFPATALVSLRAAEQVLERVRTKLLFCAGALSGRPYLSEILMSTMISFVPLRPLAVLGRQFVHRVVRMSMWLYLRVCEDCGRPRSEVQGAQVLLSEKDVSSPEPCQG